MGIGALLTKVGGALANTAKSGINDIGANIGVTPFHGQHGQDQGQVMTPVSTPQAPGIVVGDSPDAMTSKKKFNLVDSLFSTNRPSTGYDFVNNFTNQNRGF